MSTKYDENPDRYAPSGYEGQNYTEDYIIPSCGLEDLDKAVFNLFDKQIPLFFDIEGETMLRIVRPTIRIHERKRVALDSIPKVIKNWSLSVIEGNTDFDDNIFNAMFDYNYKDEVIGKPLQGVNIINKL